MRRPGASKFNPALILFGKCPLEGYEILSGIFQIRSIHSNSGTIQKFNCPLFVKINDQTKFCSREYYICDNKITKTMRQLTFVSLQVKNLDASKAFYEDLLGFEVGNSNPQACVFKYNQGEASFAIRTPLETLEDRELGIGVAIWFAVEENVEELKEKFIGNGVTTAGEIIETPFGRAFHVKDLDGYKLTFLNAK